MSKAEFRPGAFQLWVVDWLTSTAVRFMSLEEAGAYFFLLCEQWIAEDCVLPDDDAVLAELSRARDRWPAMREKVLRCFNAQKFPQKIFNEKLRAQWLERKQWQKKCQQGGKSSGISRRKAAKGSSQIVPSKSEGGGEVDVKGRPTSSSSSSSSSSLVHKNELNELTPLTPLNGGPPVGGRMKKYPAKGDCTEAEIQVAEELFRIMNQRAGMHFQARHPNGQPTENVKFVAALLRLGHDPDELRRVALHQFTFWSSRADGAGFVRDYYRPETLFNQTKYAGYVAKLPPKAPVATGAEVVPLERREVGR